LIISEGRTTKHSSVTHHSLETANRRHPAPIKTWHAKEDWPLFVNNLGERIEQISFERNNRTEPWPVWRYAHGTATQPKTVISLDITARENTTKLAHEADSSRITLERFATFLDQEIQEKSAREVRQISRKTQSGNGPETCHGVPDGIWTRVAGVKGRCPGPG
jgi:hypothetical protein